MRQLLLLLLLLLLGEGRRRFGTGTAPGAKGGPATFRHGYGARRQRHAGDRITYG